jgi:hypothetical protein
MQTLVESLRVYALHSASINGGSAMYLESRDGIVAIKIT